MASLDDLDGLYGPLASHAEHHFSNRIRYHLAGEANMFTGWLILRTRYMTVEAGSSYNSYPVVRNFASYRIVPDF